MTKNEIVFKSKSISKIYKMGGVSVKALSKISLSIKKGEFISIAGPSGSGKSTLMHIIGCLDLPTSGKVILEGRELSQLNEEELAKVRNQKIGFVFQQFNLLPRTSALDNVALPLIYGNNGNELEIKNKAESALRMVGLGNRLEYHPNQLSGGQQQRVAIARAIVTNPTIILADEPTGNLDSKSGTAILKIFKNLHQQGKTVVVVTHDQEIASQAQKIIHLKDGKIVPCQ